MESAYHQMIYMRAETEITARKYDRNKGSAREILQSVTPMAMKDDNDHFCLSVRKVAKSIDPDMSRHEMSNH